MKPVGLYCDDCNSFDCECWYLNEIKVLREAEELRTKQWSYELKRADALVVALAQLERERDELSEDLMEFFGSPAGRIYKDQLAAMTKEEVQRTKQWSYELKRADALVVELAACETARDEKEVALKDAVALYQAFQDQLVAMTKERDTFRKSYLECVDGHNLTLDELAACEKEMDDARPIQRSL